MVGIWTYFGDPDLFFWLLKGRCHDNYFRANLQNDFHIDLSSFQVTLHQKEQITDFAACQ